MCQEEGICMEGSSGQRVLAASLLRITSFEAAANVPIIGLKRKVGEKWIDLKGSLDDDVGLEALVHWSVCLGMSLRVQLGDDPKLKGNPIFSPNLS